MKEDAKVMLWNNLSPRYSDVDFTLSQLQSLSLETT
jgi:hypothetical protein